MRRIMTWVAAGLFILAAAAPQAGRADLAWIETTTTVLTIGGVDQKIGEARQNYSLKENVVRIDNPDARVTRIVNFQNRKVVIIDFNSHSYALLDMADLIRENNAQRAAVVKALDQREAALPQMDPETRQLTAVQIEAQKRKYELWARTYEVVATEDKQVIGGHPCVKYEGRAGGEKFQEIWVAEDIALDRSYPIHFGRGMATLDPQSYSHLSRLQGFPVRVVTHYGAVTVTTEMTNVTGQPVPAEALTLPEDLSPAANVVQGQ